MPRRRIFISYRRGGVDGKLAQLIEAGLRERGLDPILDVDSEEPGLFPERLLRLIAGASGLVLVLTKSTFAQPRNPDYVVEELKLALPRQGFPIVPVLDEETEIGEVNIPAEISQVTKMQAVPVSSEYRKQALDRLARMLLPKRSLLPIVVALALLAIGALGFTAYHFYYCPQNVSDLQPDKPACWARSNCPSGTRLATSEQTDERGEHLRIWKCVDDRGRAQGPLVGWDWSTLRKVLAATKRDDKYEGSWVQVRWDGAVERGEYREGRPEGLWEVRRGGAVVSQRYSHAGDLLDHCSVSLDLTGWAVVEPLPPGTLKPSLRERCREFALRGCKENRSAYVAQHPDAAAKAVKCGVSAWHDGRLESKEDVPLADFIVIEVRHRRAAVRGARVALDTGGVKVWSATCQVSGADRDCNQVTTDEQGDATFYYQKPFKKATVAVTVDGKTQTFPFDTSQRPLERYQVNWELVCNFDRATKRLGEGVCAHGAKPALGDSAEVETYRRRHRDKIRERGCTSVIVYACP